jgi:hypothetical protein
MIAQYTDFSMLDSKKIQGGNAHPTLRRPFARAKLDSMQRNALAESRIY